MKTLTAIAGQLGAILATIGVLITATTAVALEATSPGRDKEANWLPTPPEGPFFYVVRLYLPETSAQDGTWKEPKPAPAN